MPTPRQGSNPACARNEQHRRVIQKDQLRISITATRVRLHSRVLRLMNARIHDVKKRRLSHRMNRFDGRCERGSLADSSERLHLTPPFMKKDGGARRDRTDDLMLAKHALSQLSYGPLTGWPELQGGANASNTLPKETSKEPDRMVVGLGRLERPTSPLSGVRSNHLSYRPDTTAAHHKALSCGVKLVREERETKTACPA